MEPSFTTSDTTATEDDLMVVESQVAGTMSGATPEAIGACARYIAETVRGQFFKDAARAAGITWARLAAYRRHYPEFGKLCRHVEDCAREARQEQREAEADRRGIEGWEEPVFRNDKQVGRVRRYSDRLLERMLAGGDPQRYGRESRGAPQGPKVMVHFNIEGLRRHMTPEEVDAEEAKRCEAVGFHAYVTTIHPTG